MIGRHMFDLVIVTLALVSLGPINMPSKAIRVSEYLIHYILHYIYIYI